MKGLNLPELWYIMFVFVATHLIHLMRPMSCRLTITTHDYATRNKTYRPTWYYITVTSRYMATQFDAKQIKPLNTVVKSYRTAAVGSADFPPGYISPPRQCPLPFYMVKVIPPFRHHHLPIYNVSRSTTTAATTYVAFYTVA